MNTEEQRQQFPSHPLYIDTDTRKRLRQLITEDTSYLLVGQTAQTPSFTFHHLQKHIKSRCPVVIQNGRDIAELHKHGLAELKGDTQFAIQQLEGMGKAAEEFRVANMSLKTRLSDLRSNFL
eukprot:GILI01048153.1.p1 GENE.GILI01048153.1~~GILI01048153.1.p1  ORF type:complete len:122 (+),score=1.79 GILI01048153.1:33-398(+)